MKAPVKQQTKAAWHTAAFLILCHSALSTSGDIVQFERARQQPYEQNQMQQAPVRPQPPSPPDYIVRFRQSIDTLGCSQLQLLSTGLSTQQDSARSRDMFSYYNQHLNEVSLLYFQKCRSLEEVRNVP